MTSQAFRAVSSALNQIENKPSVEIRSFALVQPGMARIVADVYHTSESKANHEQALAVINNKLQAKMRCVPGTFDSLSKTEFIERVSGLVSVNKQSLVPDEQLTGFRALSSNMFMHQDDESMWVLRKTEGGNLLIKTTGVEDDVSLAGLLQATCSTSHASDLSHAHRSLSNYTPFVVEAGDLLTVVDANDQTRTAFVVCTIEGSDDVIIQAQGQDEPEQISVAAIIEKHDVSQVPDDDQQAAETAAASVSAARKVAGVTEMASYYKRVFQRRPAYFAEFMKRVRSRKFA